MIGDMRIEYSELRTPSRAAPVIAAGPADDSAGGEDADQGELRPAREHEQAEHAGLPDVEPGCDGEGPERDAVRGDREADGETGAHRGGGLGAATIEAITRKAPPRQDRGDRGCSRLSVVRYFCGGTGGCGALARSTSRRARYSFSSMSPCAKRSASVDSATASRVRLAPGTVVTPAVAVSGP